MAMANSFGMIVEAIGGWGMKLPILPKLVIAEIEQGI
jgi:hypothetical protein